MLRTLSFKGNKTEEHSRNLNTASDFAQILSVLLMTIIKS